VIVTQLQPFGGGKDGIGGTPVLADLDNLTSATIEPNSGYWFSLSGDGQHVAYSRIDASGGWQEMLADVDRSAYTSIGQPEYVLFTPDSSQIVFSRGGALLSMASGGDTTVHTTAASFDDKFPIITPDSSHVVYGTMGANGAPSLRSAAADRGQLRRAR
jgi:Tol biopolymer transport system component